MQLDDFLELFLQKLVNIKGINTIKCTIKEQMYLNLKDYDTTKIDCSLISEDGYYDAQIDISLKSYKDGEILCMDFYKN